MAMQIFQCCVLRWLSAVTVIFLSLPLLPNCGPWSPAVLDILNRVSQNARSPLHGQLSLSFFQQFHGFVTAKVWVLGSELKLYHVLAEYHGVKVGMV